MSKGLEFIDGKFMLDGKVVPPKFGDQKQIELLEIMSNIKNALKTGELDVPCWESGEDDAPYVIHFTCLCGRKKDVHPKAWETEFETGCELTLDYVCECGTNWHAKSEEGFFFNFKIKSK